MTGLMSAHTPFFLNKHLDDLDDSRRYVCPEHIGAPVDIGNETSESSGPRAVPGTLPEHRPPARYPWMSMKRGW